MKEKTATLALLGILLGGLAVRSWGIGQGYPDFYGHVDEIGVAASIWNFFRAGTLLPTEFTYPAFYSYLVAGLLWLSAWLGAAPEMERQLDALVLVSYVDPARLALIGRGLSAVLSSLAIFVTYRLGRQAFGPGVGLLAALLLAFSRAPIVQAHQGLPDSTMAFLALLCFYFSWKIYQRGNWLDYAAAGIAAGLVVATKYNGAFSALAIVAGHILRAIAIRASLQKTVLAGKLWLAIGLAFIALFGGSPYLFLAHEKYLAVATYQVSSLDFTLGQTTPWWWIVEGLVGSGYDLGGMALVAGIGWALYRRSPLDWIFLAAWVPSFAYIGSWTRESMHYLLHFYPLLALGGARVVLSLAGHFRLGWLTYVLAAGCILPNVYLGVRHASQLMHPDTRALAADWIEENLPEGTRLGMTWLPYCPRLDLQPMRQSLRNYYRGNLAAQEYLDAVWRGKPAYHLVNLEVWRQQPVVPEYYRDKVDLEDPETRRIFRRNWLSAGQLRDREVEYIVLPEAVYGRYLRDELPPQGTAAHFHYLKNHTYFKHLIASQSAVAERVASILSGPDTRGGTIHIFRLLP